MKSGAGGANHMSYQVELTTSRIGFLRGTPNNKRTDCISCNCPHTLKRFILICRFCRYLSIILLKIYLQTMFKIHMGNKNGRANMGNKNGSKYG